MRKYETQKYEDENLETFYEKVLFQSSSVIICSTYGS